jgi:hypothetical protein
MDKAALVSVDLEKGSRILQILDDAGLRVNVALWAVLADYGDWRLILSSRKFDVTDLRKAYGLLHDALDAAGFTLEETPPVVILRSNDPFVKAMRKIFGKAKSIEGMRLGGQAFGDRFIDDGYAYRIS